MNATNNIKYSPQLDGLRAICIIFTLFNHIEGAPWWIKGSVGVDIFFALSGFLITKILLESEAKGVSLRSFYTRRFFRIAPVYYLAVASTALAAFLIASASGNNQKLIELKESWPHIILFMGEYRPEAAGTFFGHSWTIGIEEKFYIIWPLIFLFIAASPWRRISFLVAIVGAFGFIGGLELRGYGGIAFGCLAAILVTHWNIKVENPAIGFVALIFSYVLLIHTTGVDILISLSAAILIPALFDNDRSIISRILANRALAWLGRLTYSIYMMHVLCFNLVKIALVKLDAYSWSLMFLLGYSVSIMVAWLIYKNLELPMIMVGRRMAGRAKSGVAEPLSAMSASATLNSAGEENRVRHH